jgi:hypothetical protein
MRSRGRKARLAPEKKHVIPNRAAGAVRNLLFRNNRWTIFAQQLSRF